MRVVIEDEYLAGLYTTGKSVGKPKFNHEIERGFIKRVVQMEQAQNTNNLRSLKSLYFEKLTGDLEGKYSVRVNLVFRIVFRIEKEDNNTRIEIIYIEGLNNHYS